ncbi:MAG: hypothetical protein NTY77_04080 [Elusimicrobia bacterium]|nr:hypothetical protein [Elusimicrobiota bacterium]
MAEAKQSLPARLVLTACLLSFPGSPRAAVPTPPDSNIGVVPTCSVLGEVIEIRPAPHAARVRLQRAHGSSTMDACGQTGAAAMADQGAVVSVSLDVQPKPLLVAGSRVFVVKGMGPDFSLETYPPDSLTVDAMVRTAETSWDGPARLSELYPVETFLGVPSTVEKLSRNLDLDAEDPKTKDKRLGSAVLLIELAVDKQDVPEPVLRKAFSAALAGSYQAVGIASHVRLIKHDRAGLVAELDGWLKKTVTDQRWPAVRDPAGIIVALGELGPASRPALPAILERMNGLNGTERDDSHTIFAAAMERMHAQAQAAALFLRQVNAGQLKSNSGPLARGACLLTRGDPSPALGELRHWCASSYTGPVR